MDLRPIGDKQKSEYNKLVTHVMQSWEWGEFRKSLQIPLLRYGIYHKNKLSKAFQLTLHKIPFTSQYVGYLPKGPFPDKELAQALTRIGQENNCAFIKIEPNVITNVHSVIPANAGIQLSKRSEDNSLRLLNESCSELDPALRRDDKPIDHRFRLSPKPLFTKYNFILDLTKSEEELLKNLHPKTRYNIKVAEKHGVKIEERTDDKAFEIYLKLYFDTTKRQGYHGHNQEYHRKVWQILRDADMARLLIAFYTKPYVSAKGGKESSAYTLNPIPLTCWMLLNFQDTLYYPYGGSSKIHPEVMANNLICWEAIKLGKKMGLRIFDMWGALGPNANPKDSWYGFHKFKQGYGGELIEYLGTYDLVFNWPVYWAFTVIDKFTSLKVFLLKLLGK